MNCTDRYPGCHDHCERYLKEKADLLEESRQIKKQEMVDSHISHTKATIYWRMKKGHRR